MNAEIVLLPATLLWPLMLAAALAAPVSRSAALRLVPSAALPALLTALLPSPDFEFTLPWLLLGSGFGVDEISGTYLLLSSILWLAAGLSLPEHNRVRFCLWFLLCMCGNFSVLLARDIPFFFLSYAVFSLAAFGLIIHNNTPAVRRAARVYLVFAIIGEMLLLTAMTLVAFNAETLDIEHVMDRDPQHLLMLLLLIGFGIKAGLPLLHMALPPVYAAAPLAAAVPMAGALLHLGLYGWMRFLPLGQETLPLWSTVFTATGLVAVVYGITIGLTQRRAKPLLAYSSISQMGLMTLALGIGLGSPEYWPTIQSVLLLFALHHALAKGALFHGLGIHGRARLGLWLPALALAGLPFTGGALAKGVLKAQITLLPETWHTLAAWLLPLGSIGTTLLMARFLWLGFGRHSLTERTSSAAWWPLLAAMLLLPWLWPLPLARVSPIWSALWPVLLAAAAAWLAWRGPLAVLLSNMPAVPPGDLLVLFEKLLRRLPHRHRTHHAHTGELDVVLQPRETPALVAAPERLLARWPVAVALLLTLVSGLLLLLTLSRP